MSMCSRPQIERQTIADRVIDRCLTCTRISPPDDDGRWAAEHRGEAVAANASISERCAG